MDQVYLNSLEKEIAQLNQEIMQRRSKFALLQEQQQKAFSKFGITTEEELEALKTKRALETQQEVKEAEEYISKAKLHIQELDSILLN